MAKTKKLWEHGGPMAAAAAPTTATPATFLLIDTMPHPSLAVGRVVRPWKHLTPENTRPEARDP